MPTVGVGHAALDLHRYDRGAKVRREAAGDEGVGVLAATAATAHLGVELGDRSGCGERVDHVEVTGALPELVRRVVVVDPPDCTQVNRHTRAISTHGFAGSGCP